MPTVKKQQPPVTSPNGATIQTQTSKSSSVLAGAVPVGQIDHKLIKLVLYGQNRVGKTTLACQFPKPLLLVACEPNVTGGAQSVTKVVGVTYLRITATEAALRLVEEIAANPHSNWGRNKGAWEALADKQGVPRYDGEPWQTVVIDTATSLQDLVLQEIMGLDQLPTQLNFGGVSGDQYRYRSERTRDILRPFLNLPVHTVVCAKEKDHNPPKEERISEKTGKVQPDMRPRFLRGMQSESYFAADLGGATVGWLHDACDYIGRLYFAKEVKVQVRKAKIGTEEREMRDEVETGRFVRCLRTMYHPNYAAGMRSCDPDTVPEYIESPTYAKIATVIRGEKLEGAIYN